MASNPEYLILMQQFEAALLPFYHTKDPEFMAQEADRLGALFEKLWDNIESKEHRRHLREAYCNVFVSLVYEIKYQHTPREMAVLDDAAGRAFDRLHCRTLDYMQQNKLLPFLENEVGELRKVAVRNPAITPIIEGMAADVEKMASGIRNAQPRTASQKPASTPPMRKKPSRFNL